MRLRDQPPVMAAPSQSSAQRRPALQELRLHLPADGAEHQGAELRSTDFQCERAESSGRERARRRLLVGLTCRGLPQGAPRVNLPSFRLGHLRP